MTVSTRTHHLLNSLEGSYSDNASECFLMHVMIMDIPSCISIATHVHDTRDVRPWIKVRLA
jgi:hypothetical protein